MAETSYPTAGGGGVTDARYEQVMAPIVGAGATGLPTQSPILYADATGRQVKVQPNRHAIIRGFQWETDDAGLTRSINANTSGQTRIDLAVLRLNRADATFSVRFDIIPGTPAAVPVAPAATQQEGSTGVWEYPIGQVKVTSSTTSGLPIIQPADVTPLESYIGETPAVCHSTRMPAAKNGKIVTQYDTGKTFIGIGTTWNLLGENGPYASVPPASGWSSSCATQRRNGFVYCYLHFQRLGSDLPAGATDYVLATLPDAMRPQPTQNLYFSGAIGGVYPARGFIRPSTGEIVLDVLAATLTTGTSLVFGPVTYPAKP